MTTLIAAYMVEMTEGGISLGVCVEWNGMGKDKQAGSP